MPGLAAEATCNFERMAIIILILESGSVISEMAVYCLGISGIFLHS